MQTQTINDLLFSTRQRIAVSLAITGLSLYLEFRPISTARYAYVPPSPWLLDLSYLGVDGWPLLAINIAIFAYVSWIAFLLIQGSFGLARTFVVAWAVTLMNWPLSFTAGTHGIRHVISVVGLSVALVAALLMLIRFVPHKRLDCDPLNQR